MKKIAFIVTDPGSATAFLYDHFIGLAKEYDIYLLANFGNYDKSKFSSLNITCHDIPIQRKISIWNDLKALSVIRKIYKKEKFDSVHSVTPKAGLLNALAGKLAGVPHRIHIYTGQVWATRKGFMRFMLKTIDKIPAMLNTNLLVDGMSQRKFLIDEGVLKEKNSCVLANGSICGVRLERFNISSEVRKTEREKFGFNEDDVVYIFLGRLNHDKGIGELYEAFNKFVADNPKAKLLLYGSDEEGYEEKSKNYPNIIRDKNFFYPGLTRTPFDALQAGDVFVLPTWREGFGSSVIEAQALALPVITSDAYGVVDASVPEETGMRCKVNDPEGLYSCMKYYYDNPEIRKQHGINGRKRVEEKFDNKVVTRAWVEFYRNMLGS